MTKNNKKLVIIDGNALIHRSFHALPATLRSLDGRATNAVYGFSSFLLKAFSELKPDLAMVAFDRKEPTFRHQEYKEYKAQRSQAPDELYEQIPLVKEVAKSLGLPIIEVAGYEADDLIGALSAQAEQAKNIETIIITGDLDTLQLVSPQTKVYTMSRGLSDSVIYDEAKVKERYGLTPAQIIDLKSLAGDPSDNIPGVKGIGLKGATDLLQKYHNLEGVIKAAKQSAPDIKPRIAQLIIEQEEQARLSYKLATIDRQAPCQADWLAANFPEFDPQAVFKLFSELDFKSLLNKVHALNFKNKNEPIEKKGAQIEDLKIIILETTPQLTSFHKQLKTFSEVALSPHWDETKNLLGLTFFADTKTAYYLPNYYLDDQSPHPLAKNQLIAPFSQDENQQRWQSIMTILKNEKIKIIAYNLKSIYKAWLKNNFDYPTPYFDLMIAAYLLHPDQRQNNLSSLAFNQLGQEFNELDQLNDDFDLIIKQQAKSAAIVWQLFTVFKKQLIAQDLLNLFTKIEIPLIPILAKMEQLGIKVEKKVLAKLAKNNLKNLQRLSQKIYRLADKEFNINSPKQLQEILFTDLEIPSFGIKKTKTGLSTAEEELNKLQHLHPIIPALQEYRELFKLQTTYLEVLPKLIERTDNRIHTTFQQTVAATGRLSSSDPNLQNIPVRNDLGRQIRQAFIAESGWQLISFDYSQIELRLTAHLSGDKQMIQAFKNDQDIHLATAAAINNLPLEKVSPKMRQEAKATNFGIIYGQGPHGLSQAAGINYARAKEFIDKYFQVYPGIKKMMEKSISQGQKTGFAITLLGRKRPLPDLNSSLPMIRKAAERMAINTPIQGSAADMIKQAMIEIDELITGKEQDIRLLLQIHDELIFEIKTDKIKDYQTKLIDIMSKVVKLKVPIIVSAATADNWGDLK